MTTVVCQVNGRLPAQCCGSGEADSVYRCEATAPPGHRHHVGGHTITHARMGNGYSCAAIEQLREQEQRP